MSTIVASRTSRASFTAECSSARSRRRRAASRSSGRAIGGGASLRGHPAGAFAGDRMAAGSVEVRLPFDSPLRAGRAGVVLFYDAGKTWNIGQRPKDLTLQQGAGAGVFLMLPFVRMNLDVARNMTSPDTRVHFGFGFSF